MEDVRETWYEEVYEECTLFCCFVKLLLCSYSEPQITDTEAVLNTEYIIDIPVGTPVNHHVDSTSVDSTSVAHSAVNRSAVAHSAVGSGDNRIGDIRIPGDSRPMSPNPNSWNDFIDIN